MDSTTLKVIAVISMIIDHTASVFLPHGGFLYLLLRSVGRLAFPIFCFLIVEGYFHTKDIKKYLYRLFAFAFISEIPFDIALYYSFPNFSHQNVFFTLAIGLIAVYLIDTLSKENRFVLAYLGFVACAVIAEMLKTDYGMKGIFIIICFYGIKKNPQLYKKIIFIVGFVLLNMSYIQYFAIFSLVLLFLYNGKRGKNYKYLFYLIYPIHLGVLAVLANVL